MNVRNVVIVVAAASVLACSSDEPAAGCSFDTDCASEQLCVDTACVPKTRFRCASDQSPVIEATPASIDFGIVEASEITQMLSIENRGECTLQITKMEIDGDQRFVCEQCGPADLPVEIAPERSLSFRLSVGTGAPGAVAADLVVTSNDRVARELRIPLTATSEGRSLMRVSPPALDFGYVPVGASKTLVVQAINDTDGTAILEIVNAYLDPSDGPFSLSVTPPVPAMLVAAREDASARAAFSVTLSPTMDAAHAADLRIVPRDGAPVIVPLTAEMSPPVAGVSPMSIDFGSLQIGQSVARSIAIQNSGPSSLELTYAFASGGAAGEMTAPQGLPPELRPGQVTELGVVYAPTRAGVASDTITIGTNDPANRTITVQLTGTGEASGQDVLRVDLTFENGSSSLLDIDLRDVDLVFESPDGQVVNQVFPNPSWGMFGNPQWSSSGQDQNPERVLLPDAMQDGRFVVNASYVEDCKTLPTALTASLLGIGTDELIDYFAEEDIPLDPNQVASAVSRACIERGSTNVTIDVYVNGLPVGQRQVRMAQKGELVQAAAIVRTNGFFALE